MNEENLEVIIEQMLKNDDWQELVPDFDEAALMMHQSAK